MAFAGYITRTGGAAELPEQPATELITAVQKESVILTMARQVPTTTRDSRIPVVDTLPAATWVTGTDPDTGLKSVTSMQITNKQLIAEELATTCVIPQDVVDDSEYDILGRGTPRAGKVDRPCMRPGRCVGRQCASDLPAEPERCWQQRPVMLSRVTHSLTRPTVPGSCLRPLAWFRRRASTSALRRCRQAGSSGSPRP